MGQSLVQQGGVGALQFRTQRGIGQTALVFRVLVQVLADECLYRCRRQQPDQGGQDGHAQHVTQGYIGAPRASNSVTSQTTAADNGLAVIPN